MRGQPKQPKIKGLSKFPSVERDLSFVVPTDVRAYDLLTEIRKSAGGDLVAVNLFDQFKGGNVPEGHVALGFRLRFQRSDKTLSDAEVQAASDKILKALSAKHSVQLR